MPYRAIESRNKHEFFIEFKPRKDGNGLKYKSHILCGLVKMPTGYQLKEVRYKMPDGILPNDFNDDTPRTPVITSAPYFYPASIVESDAVHLTFTDLGDYRFKSVSHAMQFINRLTMGRYNTRQAIDHLFEWSDNATYKRHIREYHNVSGFKWHAATRTFYDDDTIIWWSGYHDSVEIEVRPDFDEYLNWHVYSAGEGEVVATYGFSETSVILYQVTPDDFSKRPLPYIDENTPLAAYLGWYLVWKSDAGFICHVAFESEQKALDAVPVYFSSDEDYL